MRRQSKKIILSIIILFVVAVGIFVGVKLFTKMRDNKLNDNNGDTNNDKEVEIYHEPTLEEKVDDEIDGLSLREKIGQMIFIAYSGTEYTEKFDGLLTNTKPGGFILFPDNIGNYEASVELITKIKESVDIPMMISVDQEGGRVQKIKDVEGVSVTEIPDMLSLGKTQDKDLAYNVGDIMGKELAAFGVNTDFAPVLDIFSNPSNTVIGNRAFGNDSQTVIDMALPFAKGLKKNNIIPTYKHFPGHGDTTEDSHFELPIVTKTKEELYENELLTFKAAIEDGAEMIMTAHIALPNVTGDYVPASLSKTIINDILREELGFDGVVITDAVNMKALSDNYTVEEICNYAINAGVDIILMPINPVDTVDTIEKLVKNGTITEERINESVKRILLMKHRNGLYESKELNKEDIGMQESIDIMNKIKE